MRFRISVLQTFLFFCLVSSAQDNHYWSQQYGAESTLLGGAMVAGANDNSAIYYNPGALGFIVNPSLSVDANVYRMDRILITDGAGNGTNLNSAQISIYPQIISGMINLLKIKKVKFSYTLLTRNHNNILMNARYTGKSGRIDPVAEVTDIYGNYDYVNQLEELWFGLGAGYKLTDKLGAGATLFTSYTGQSYSLENTVKNIDYSETGYIYSSALNNEAVRYSNVGLLAKAGLSYLSGKFRYGVTLTSPSIRIYGRGRIQRDNSDIVVSDNPEDMSGNFLISDNKSNIKTYYKHPLSVSMGIDYQTVKARLALSAEYFFRINDYHLMKPVSEPFLYPPSYLDSIDMRDMIDNYLHVKNAAKPVFNIAFGFSHVLYKNLFLLLGASTDFSNFEDVSEKNGSMDGFGKWDIYHFSSGISYHKSKHYVSFGPSYAYTPSKAISQYSNISEVDGAIGNAVMYGHSLSFVLGYTYFFARSDK